MLADRIGALDPTDAGDVVRAAIATGGGRAFYASADLSGGAATFAPWFVDPDYH